MSAPAVAVRERPNDAVGTRFWAKVNFNGPVHPTLGTRCWTWNAGLNGGYGQFSISGRSRLAHRVAWFLAHGAWPKGALCHRCDNPRCVRPAHLWDGTQRQNLADMRAKGRGKVPTPARLCGEANPQARLTVARVRLIRSRLAAGAPKRAIAREVGCSETVVRQIAKGEIWRSA